jgi:hypothetical protein
MMKTKASEKTVSSVERAAQNMAETLLLLIDKLAGKGSDIKLSFEDLNLEIGILKAKLNGAIVLDVVYAKEVS